MSFFRQFAPGLVMLFVAYFFLTAYRDFRDNFAAELFNLMGYGGEPDVFAKSETNVAFGVMVALAGLNLIRSNRWGLIGGLWHHVAGHGVVGRRYAAIRRAPDQRPARG